MKTPYRAKMLSGPSTPNGYAELLARLRAAEDKLLGLRDGDADPICIQCLNGPNIYTLLGQEAETNRFHSTILSQVGDVVIATDNEERITYLNAAARVAYRINTSDVLGQTLSFLYASEWLQHGDESAAMTALEKRGEWRGEKIHIKRDGSRRNVEVDQTQLRNVDGLVTGRLSVIRDVTERKQVDKKLRLSEMRYRRLFEAAHDGVVIIDPATCRIIDANPFMIDLLGYSRAELIGKELFEIGLFKDEAASQAMIMELKRTTQVRYQNLPLEGVDRQHHDVEVVANLYDEDGHSIIQCNVRDITDRRRAEEHISLLIAEVNHRARNLLSVVMAVARQTATSGDAKTFIARLSDRIDGLAAGQDLLVESEWQGVEVLDLVSSQLGHFKDLIGTRVLIDGPRAWLNPGAAQGIGMALHELATNAAKYGALSNLVGIVRISWRIDPTPKPSFSISWEESGGPKVAAPTRNGFGNIVIGRMAGAAVNGLAEMRYEENGIAWHVTGPAESALLVGGVRN